MRGKQSDFLLFSVLINYMHYKMSFIRISAKRKSIVVSISMLLSRGIIITIYYLTDQ